MQGRHLIRWTGALAALAALPALLALSPVSTPASGADDARAPDRTAGRRAPRRSSGTATSATRASSSTAALVRRRHRLPRPRASRSDYDWGCWNAAGDLLNGQARRGRSTPACGDPRSSRAPTAGVAYYTMPSRGLPHEQDRCIGVATAPTWTYTFTPVSNRPLVCPDYSTTQPAFDPVAGRVGLPRRGVIDPSSFIARRRPPLPALPHAGQALDDPDDPPQRRRHRHLRPQPRADPRQSASWRTRSWSSTASGTT